MRFSARRGWSNFSSGMAVSAFHSRASCATVIGMRVAAACLLAIIPGALGIQAQQSPADLYQRTREHVKEQIQRLPRYTCVQTITRHVYRNPSSKTSNCERILRNRQGMKPVTVQWDRL